MVKIAIVGATKRIGIELLEVLQSQEFNKDNIIVLDSSSHYNEKLKYGDDDFLKVQKLDSFVFSGIDIVVNLLNESVLQFLQQKQIDFNFVIIDNSGSLYKNFSFPSVIADVNLHHINKNLTKTLLNPNCTTTILASVLSPLYIKYKMLSANVSTYQSVSGAGNLGLEALFNQSKAIFTQGAVALKTEEEIAEEADEAEKFLASVDAKENNNKIEEETKQDKPIFTKQIAFNLIPHIGDFLPNGNTTEEENIILETNKILQSSINITATCVRVPIFIGHCLAVTINFNESVLDSEIREFLKKQPNIAVVDFRLDQGYVSPFEVAGESKIYITRIKNNYEINHNLEQKASNSINLFIVADNLQVSANNIVNIIKNYLN
jgi:aspartate-semialdehyde dehydrogenase